MKPEYELYQQIDNYLKNKLSETERQEFDQKLKVDSELQEQVDLQLLTNELIVENRFDQIFNNAVIANTNTKSYSKAIIGGTSILIALIGSIFLFNDKSEKDLSIKSNPVSVISEPKTELKTEIVKPTINKEEKIKKSIFTYSPIDKYIEKENIEPITSNTSALEISEDNVIDEIKDQYKMDVIVDICATTKINADIFSVPSCTNDSTGKITISTTTIKGGKAPYLFGLNNSEFSNNSEFNNLKSGLYNIFIKDANNCIIEIYKEFKLVDKNCFKQLNFSFNPHMGESWNYNPGVNSNYSVKITSKNGDVVWKNNLSEDNQINWDGNNSNGGIVESGIYIYEINFLNGVNQHGTITILK